MDFKNLANKAKEALGKNPNLIDKAGDFVDERTGKKFEGHVDKAQDAAKKFVGGEQAQNEQPQPEQGEQQQPEQQ